MLTHTYILMLSLLNIFGHDVRFFWGGEGGISRSRERLYLIKTQYGNITAESQGGVPSCSVVYHQRTYGRKRGFLLWRADGYAHRLHWCCFVLLNKIGQQKICHQIFLTRFSGVNFIRNNAKTKAVGT